MVLYVSNEQDSLFLDAKNFLIRSVAITKCMQQLFLKLGKGCQQIIPPKSSGIETVREQRSKEGYKYRR